MNKYGYKVIRRLRDFRKGFTVNPISIYKELLKSQYWTAETIKSYQLEKINDLLSIARNSSVYYQKLLKDINLPLKSLEEFESQIPYITKEIEREQNVKLRTSHFCTKYKHATSGTTGDVVVNYNSDIADAYREAGLLRFLSWWNIEPHDTNVLIWGKKDTAKSRNRITSRLKGLLNNRYDMEAFKLEAGTIKKYYDELLLIKPKFIRGYKSSIIQLAELMEENHLPSEKFRLKAVVVTSEMLFEKERDYIEKILHCPVANEYGTSDAGEIGFECPKGSMHIFEEAEYVFTDSDNEAVITEFYNNSMPLINFKNNDRIVLTNKQCSCGRSSRLISQLEGRDEDLIIKENGEKVNALIFLYIVAELDDLGIGNSIGKWKVIQYNNNLQMRLIKKPNYSPQVEEHIRKRVHQLVGPNTTMEFCLVDSIPKEKNGKLRFFERIS